MTLPRHVWPFELTEFVGNGFDTDLYARSAATAPQPAAESSRSSTAESSRGQESPLVVPPVPSRNEARQLLARLLMDEDTQRRYPLDSSARFWEFCAIWHGLDPGLVDLDKPGRREFLERVAILTLVQSPALFNFLLALDERQVLRDLTRWPEAVVHFDKRRPHRSVVVLQALVEKMREDPIRSCTPVAGQPTQLTVYKNTDDFGKLLKVSLESHPGWLATSLDRPRPSAAELQAKLRAEGVSSGNLITAGATYLNSPTVRKGGNIEKAGSRRSMIKAKQRENAAERPRVATRKG